jgi:hypothetical protein
MQGFRSQVSGVSSKKVSGVGCPFFALRASQGKQVSGFSNAEVGMRNAENTKVKLRTMIYESWKFQITNSK